MMETLEDYYRLEQTLVPEQGKYQLVIGEFENEHSYFDAVRLLAVDHDADIEVAVTSEGEILTYKDPYPPVSAIDDQGNNVLESVKEIDGQYYEGYEGSCIEQDFGDLNVGNGAKLVLRTDQPPVKEPMVHSRTVPKRFRRMDNSCHDSSTRILVHTNC